MEDSLLKQSIDDWKKVHRRIRNSLITRLVPGKVDTKFARAFIGVRRSGKTTLAIQTFQNEIFDSVLYYNFEDPVFYPNGQLSDLDSLLRVAQEYTDVTIKNLILDEIQNVPGWERWVRKIIDQEQFKVVITGSSAKLLSKELATAVAGRALESTVWPLSFKEYLKFLNLKPESVNEYLAHLSRYIEWGGYPEIVKSKADLKADILRQYLSDIVLKDVMSRNEIRNKRTLDQIITFYLTNLSSLHSYSSIKKAFSTGIDTISNYTEYLKDAFLIFEVERFHNNLKIQARDPKKIYVIDIGLRKVGARSVERDKGKLLENIIFIELKRRNKQIMYFKGQQEVDFLILENYRPKNAIQVCAANMQDEETFNREIQALVECLRSTGLRNGEIITWNREQTIKIDRFKLSLKPAYKWLLE